MMNAQANTLAGLSFIAFVLLIPVQLWHLRSRNIPACSLTFWLMYLNLTAFINACIWSGDDYDSVWKGQGYCDITLKLEAASSPGKICAISALALNLFFVLRAKNPRYLTNSTRKLVLDSVICFVTPAFIIATNYVIQTCRYVVVRYRGCTTAYAGTAVTVVLFSMWTIIWSVFALVCSLLTLYMYFKTKKDVRDILRCTNSGLDLKRFARLLIFSLLVVIFLVPLAVYNFVCDSAFYNGKFSWSGTHGEDWNTIYHADFGIAVVYDKWVNIGLSVLTFLLFGLGSDAVSVYKNICCKIGLGRLFTASDKPDSEMEIKLDRLYNTTTDSPGPESCSMSKKDSPVSQLVLSNMSTQTKVDSHGSHPSKPIMIEFRNEINELLDEDDDLESQRTKKNSFIEKTFDTTSSEPSSSATTEHFDHSLRNEFDYIINQAVVGRNDSLSYNYQVRRK